MQQFLHCVIMRSMYRLLSRI